MPELIRLQTPDFEFSVWANDISQRLRVHQNTMAHRASANHAQPSYELRFAPAAQLSSAIEPQGLVADGLVQSGSDESDLAENDLIANDWAYVFGVNPIRNLGMLKSSAQISSIPVMEQLIHGFNLR